MRKIVPAFLLLSLFAVLPQLLHAQTRPRRVGQTTGAPPPESSTPARRPTLGGATTNDSTRPSPAPPSSNGPQEIEEGEVVRVNTTLVTIPVSVMDRNGKYIPDLRQEDFRIYEDGVQQEIAYFATVEKPFTVALLLDTSGSTRFRLEDMQDAAIAFVNQLRPDDRVMVVSFDDEIRVLSEPTNDRYALRNAIQRTRTGDGTRLYDAVDLVINQRFNRIKGRKAIVLFTDGVDTTSKRSSFQRNVQDAEELDALIYPVQYDTYDANVTSQWPSRRSPSVILRWPFPFPMPLPVPSGGGGGAGSTREEYERADAYLREMAQKTGGRIYRADDVRNLSQAFALIAEELRRQYSLGYYPKMQAQAGQRRNIKVRVNQPNLVVRARDSYIYNPSGPQAAQGDERQPSKPEMRKRQLAEKW